MVTYYDILKVKTTASQAEIKAAYKKLALLYHPDRNNGRKESEEQFKLLFEAYKTLSNTAKRRIYDHKHHIYKSPPVKYAYHQGGFYRSMMQQDQVKTYQANRPDVFTSKKKDIDFYLFWFTIIFIFLLIGFLVLKASLF